MTNGAGASDPFLVQLPGGPTSGWSDGQYPPTAGAAAGQAHADLANVSIPDDAPVNLAEQQALIEDTAHPIQTIGFEAPQNEAGSGAGSSAVGGPSSDVTPLGGGGSSSFDQSAGANALPDGVQFIGFDPGNTPTSAGTITDTVTSAGSGFVFNNTFDSGVTTAFRNEIIAAENYLQSLFTNTCTVNCEFNAESINPNFSGENSFSPVHVSYSAFVNALTHEASTPVAQEAAAALSTLADPSNGAGFNVSVGEARILGLAGAGNGIDDTVILNSVYWTASALQNDPGDAEAVLEHELSEGIMGRVGGLGVDGGWAPMDLFRFTASGQRDFTGGKDGLLTYFSPNGSNVYTGLQFHNSVNSSGQFDGFDLADWDGVGADSNDTDPFGPGGPGTGDPGTLSATDIAILQALGWSSSSPSLSVSLSGTAAVGQTLTAVPVESGSNAAVSYQWQEFNGSSWNNISGATGSTYQLQQSDANDLVRVVASIVANGQTIYAVSGNDGPVAGPSLSVTLSGTAQVGQTLTAVPVETGTTAAVSYQWQHFNGTSWTNIAGATGSTYQLQTSDTNDLIRVVASIVANGQTIYAIGGNDGPVTGPSLSVSLSGTAQIGQTLTAVPAESGTTAAVSYQWQEFNGTSWNNISGATNSTYQLQTSDVNDLVRVVASIVANGQTIYAVSGNDGPVAGPSLSVSLSGTAQVGQTLTAVPVESGSNASVSYQWQEFNGSSWNNISGATGSTYQLQSSDTNDLVRVVASIVANGQTIYAVSGNDGPVTGPSLSVSLSGTAAVGQTLTAVPAESGTTAAVSYQWQEFNGSSWNNISGATGSTYQLQQSDTNDLVRAVASIVANGQTIYAVSSNDGPVAAAANGNLVNNGNFATGNFSGWTIVTTPNGGLGPSGSGLPAVTSFNVTGSGAQNAATFQAGELTPDGTQQGGGIEQTITTSGGAITFSADVAAIAGSSNYEAGVFSLLVDGVIENSIDFGYISANAVDYGAMSFTTPETAGQHTFGIQITRPYTNGGGTPEEFVTNVSVQQQSGATSSAATNVPSSAAIQLNPATALGGAPLLAYNGMPIGQLPT